jgi:hypothetical protein
MCSSPSAYFFCWMSEKPICWWMVAARSGRRARSFSYSACASANRPALYASSAFFTVSSTSGGTGGGPDFSRRISMGGRCEASVGRVKLTWRVAYPGASTSTFQVPATRPRYAHRPFLSVLRVGPPPRAGKTSLRVAPATGVPSEATTRPSARPLPFQSWACATLAPRTARLRMLPRTSLGKAIKADLLIHGL